MQGRGRGHREQDSIPFYRTGAPVTLQLFGTVGAIHLFLMENKALVGQVHGAFFAVEAVVVPGLSFIGHHTGAFTKPSDGVLASSTLLGHKVLVAIHAVILVLHSGETLPSQLLRAGNTHKALGMPGLILVSDSSRCDGLVALHAMLGKFGLVASCAVEVLPFREEASSPDHLLAVAAGETVFVPDDPLVLHVLISWHNWLEAALALEGFLPRSALVAQDLVVLGHKGLIGQGVKALGAAKAGIVPVAVLVVHLLAVRTDGLAAVHAGVGAELVKALQAGVVAILLHVLLPLQGVPAVVAVKLLSHGAHPVPGGTSHWMCGERMCSARAGYGLSTSNVLPGDARQRSCPGGGRCLHRHRDAAVAVATAVAAAVAD